MEAMLPHCGRSCVVDVRSAALKVLVRYQCQLDAHQRLVSKSRCKSEMVVQQRLTAKRTKDRHCSKSKSTITENEQKVSGLLITTRLELPDQYVQHLLRTNHAQDMLTGRTQLAQGQCLCVR